MGNATQGAGGPLIGVLPNGATVGGTWTFTGPLRVTDTTASSGTTTGCLVLSGGLGVAGAIQTGAPLVVTTGAAPAFINAISNAGVGKGILVRSGATARWFYGGDGVAESGADAGTPWVLQASNDAGAAIDVPIHCLRASGAVMTFGGTTRRTLSTTGGRIVALVVATDTLTLDATHHSVVCNKATAMTVNLPAVASNAGREYIISNKGAGVVTIDANASELIDNATTKTLNQWQSYMLHCDGAIWKIVG